jgi:hypothetical protein
MDKTFLFYMLGWAGLGWAGLGNDFSLFYQ